jgi:hypothetical protein
MYCEWESVNPKEMRKCENAQHQKGELKKGYKENEKKRKKGYKMS